MTDLTVRDAKILFRNFSGKGTQYTPEGRRTFSLLIEDEELATQLMNDGWNIKPLKKRDENDPQHWHLPVAVFFGKYPPQIVTISGGNQAYIGEGGVNKLDFLDIERINLTIHPKVYDTGFRQGVKAYLKTMICWIREDELLAELNDGFGGEEELPF